MHHVLTFMVGTALMLTAGASLGLADHTPSPALTPPPSATPPPLTYAAQVRALDLWVTDGVARTQRDPRSWLGWESLANAYRARALFTGTALDLGRADAAIDHSFQVAGRGAGPYLSRAKLRASEHRNDEVGSDLVRASEELSLDIRDQATIAALRAGIAFQSGRYGEAFAAWDASLRLCSQPGTLFALADATAATGDPATAEILIGEALMAANPRDVELRTWLLLQHGVLALDQGHWDDATLRYQQAAALLPGWWQVEMRQAELLVRQGRQAEALAAYLGLAQRTGKPEAMDATAALLLRSGRDREAAAWTAIARLAYDDLLTQQPAAAAGHALDHYLAHNDQPQHTLELALRNQHLRPGGEATLKLALAYLAAERLTEARAAVDMVLASPYATAQAFLVANTVYRACGEDQRAAAALRRAQAIDPHAGETTNAGSAARPAPPALAESAAPHA